jgi:4-hydroxybenzoate polyprenyltransferase
MTTRPQFDPLTDEEHRGAKGHAVLPWLRLMRLPNVFTAIADVTMGYLFAHQSVGVPERLACAVLASASLYTAGMVLNDVFDVKVDAKERPFRPLPSGQISLNAANWLGWLLLAVGVGLGWLPGLFFDASPWLSGVVAIVLAASIVAYDGFLKKTPVGPVAMGACRFLNVLLGMSTSLPAGAPLLLVFGSGPLMAAAGIGIYIAGVTSFAKREAETSQKTTLWAAMGVMAAGVALLGAAVLPFRGLAMDRSLYWLLLVLLMITVLRRCIAAAVDPAPEKVQAAVKHSILSLIWLDAATAAAVAGPMYGIAVAALLIPALVLGWWVYST